jgi:hypothetical protein
MYILTFLKTKSDPELYVTDYIIDLSIAITVEILSKEDDTAYFNVFFQAQIRNSMV